MWKGIDVSDNQGVINWQQVKQAGCQFAVLRSVRRSGKTDYQFLANLTGCRSNEIPISVYKYTYATSEAAAQEEARQVLNLLQSNNLKCKIWWDIEDRDTLFPLGKDKLTSCIKAAQKVIETAGYEFCIYTGLYVYREKWFFFEQFTCPIWVARYPSTAQKTLDSQPAEKYLPDVGRSIWGWQFSSNGKVPGITTKCDLDICYFDPNEGSIIEELEESYMFCISGLNCQEMQDLQKQFNNRGISGKTI